MAVRADQAFVLDPPMARQTTSVTISCQCPKTKKRRRLLDNPLWWANSFPRKSYELVCRCQL